LLGGHVHILIAVAARVIGHHIQTPCVEDLA
jgi:hypothetical protein